MGIFSGSRDRANATFFIKEMSDNLVYFCERAEDSLSESVRNKLSDNTYTNTDEVFLAINPELTSIKDLVFQSNVLDSASRLIIEKGSPSMRQMMFSVNKDIDQCREFLWNKALEIEEWIQTNNLSSNNQEKENGYWASTIVFIDVQDWSERQWKYARALQVATQKFL